MAVVDGGGYFEIVVEVLRHITFADTTFEIGVKGVGLKIISPLALCVPFPAKVELTDPGTSSVGTTCITPNLSASEQNCRGSGCAREIVAKRDVRRAALKNFILTKRVREIDRRKYGGAVIFWTKSSLYLCQFCTLARTP